jgi:hypothetical protein
MSDTNIWTDEWDEGEDWSGGGSKQTGHRLWFIYDVPKPADG